MRGEAGNSVSGETIHIIGIMSFPLLQTSSPSAASSAYRIREHTGRTPRLVKFSQLLPFHEQCRWHWLS